MNSEPAVVQGVVVVVRRGERYLVIRRAAGIVAGGAWCFAGGAIEPGESQEAAVVREFREELGATVRPVARVWESLRPDGRLRLHWWQAELLDADLHPNPAEVAEARWCRLDEVAALPNLLDSNRQFLRVIQGSPG